MTTTASAKNLGGGSGGGGINDGSEKRKPICVCNAQFKLQQQQQKQMQQNRTQPEPSTKIGLSTTASLTAIGTLAKKHHHGSLDKLDTDETTGGKFVDKPEIQKFYQQINGDIIEWTGRTHKLKTVVAPPQPQSSTSVTPTTSDVSTSKQDATKFYTISSKAHLENTKIRQQQAQQLQFQYQQQQQQQQQIQHQPTKSISQQQYEQQLLIATELLEKLTKPVPKPRQLIKHKSADSEYNFRTARPEQRNDFFDRTQQQRLSSRSVEGPARNETIEWFEQQGLHQRHSSGPSELSLFKDDSIAEWLLNITTKVAKEDDASKKTPPPIILKEKPQSGISKIVKDELTDIFKKPLQRQSSGPSEISVLKSDIIDWLSRQQQHVAKLKASVHKTKEEAKSKFIKKQVDESKQSQLDARKRHSLGATNDGNNVKESFPEWIPYPIQKLSSLPREQFVSGQGSCVDLNKKIREPSDSRGERVHRHERKLRHSASEVVTSTSDKIPPPKPERQINRQHHQTQRSSSKDFQQTQSKKISKTHRHHQTQRSATVADMVEAKLLLPKKQICSVERNRRSSSLSRCTDPSCPLLPVCTDPKCCYTCSDFCNTCTTFTPTTTTTTPTQTVSSMQSSSGTSIHHTKRSSTQPVVNHHHHSKCKDLKCSSLCYEYKCYSLPRCMDSKCTSDVNVCSQVKCNSLPRYVESYRSTTKPSGLSKSDSRSSLPRSTKSNRKHHTNGSNGKLIKSVSAVSLNSRRRRHKTVHFGENLLREVCQNRKLLKPFKQDTPSDTTAAPLQPNIQMLYNFVEGVLSAWVDEEEDDEHIKSGPDSEPERGAVLKSMHRCNRARFQTIRRVVTEAASLKGTLKLGNSRYRHRHWRGTAKECNERFLKKVNILY